MISALKEAIKKAEKLSDAEQKRIADLILDEINWDQTLQKSQHELSKLAEEALEEYKKGKTKPLNL